MTVTKNATTAGTFPHRVWGYVAAHKFWSTVAIVILVGGAWWGYQKTQATTAQTRYVLGTVQSGTIVASVSESGQVSTTNSIDIQPQVSGQITWIGIKAGQTVRAGQTLMTIDNTSAVQAIVDAKRTLAADQLTYQQSQAQAPISYQNDQNALATATANLQDDYSSVYNDLTTVYLDLPTAAAGAKNTLYGYDFDTSRTVTNGDYLLNFVTSMSESNPSLGSSNLQSLNTSAKNDYNSANSAYVAAVAAYNDTSRSSDPATIDAVLSQSITMTTAMAQALQSELNYFGAVSDFSQSINNAHLPSSFSTVQSNARTYLTTVSNDLSTLLADKNTIDTAKQTIVNDQNTVTLDQVGNPNGNNPISLQISSNSIQKEEEDLAAQEADLTEYTITAPFDGTVSVVNVQTGNSASGSLATVVSNSQIADLSVNEVDAAKIALGNKATVTFDAIDGLTLTGTVAQINNVGTVSQGVVSYDVKISFDTQDPRVKPGMTVNANIQTAVDQNVLMVPSTAVKTTAGSSYVLAFDPPIASSTVASAGTQGILSPTTPVQIPVQTGISDNTNVEITSGLTEGEQIVTRTTSSGTAVTAAASATSRTGGGGGMLRGL